METNELILTLTEEERAVLTPLVLPEKVSSLQRLPDGLYKLIMDGAYAEVLSEKVKEVYVAEGFDIHYELTSKGKVLEALVDKFTDLGC